MGAPRRSRAGGFTLLEVMVAMAVGLLGAVALGSGNHLKVTLRGGPTAYMASLGGGGA